MPHSARNTSIILRRVFLLFPVILVSLFELGYASGPGDDTWKKAREKTG